MSLFNSNRKNKLNNAGMSLIELLVVISIMSIMTGTMAISANLVFSKDAEKCATRLNDAINTARMNAMSKPGSGVLEIKKQGGEYVAVYDDGSSECLSENNKISKISCSFNGSNVVIDGSDSVSITFDKSKGIVADFNGEDLLNSGVSGLAVFTVEQTTGSKKSDVTLVTATGKHMLGTLE